MQTKLLINGEFVAGEGEALPVFNPATGQEIARVSEASPEQVRAATAAASRAFESWSRTTPAERSAMLLAVADAIEAATDELGGIESTNGGKPLVSAIEDEMPLTIDVFRFTAGAARTMSGSAAGEYVAGHTSMIRRDPIGPIAAIAPWNYPLMMASWKLAAPLAAGCTIVLKPSELTPLSTLRLAEIMTEIFPPGVVNVVHGRGASVGEQLINDPHIEGISITGSPGTGQAAMRAASQQIRQVHLELGGKAPVIVFDDADIETLVETIRGGSYFNAGQDCAQPTRIMVSDRVYDRVVADTAAAVSTIRMGAPDTPDVEMGPLISASQRETVSGFVDRARGHAEVITGGAAGEGGGYFYAATVVADVDNDAEIATNEVFGPVVSISRFSDVEDAVGLAKDRKSAGEGTGGE